MTEKCRLCYSNNIKITITTKDSIIKTLAEFVPEIVNNLNFEIKIESY